MDCLSHLDDMDFADDIALLSHPQKHTQDKMSRVNNYAHHTSRPKDQPCVDKGDDAECDDCVICHREWR